MGVDRAQLTAAAALPDGYARGMTIKIAISLPDEQVADAKRAVSEGRAASVSAYISESLENRQRTDNLAALLADLDREYGPVSDEALAWADDVRGLG